MAGGYTNYNDSDVNTAVSLGRGGGNGIDDLLQQVLRRKLAGMGPQAPNPMRMPSFGVRSAGPTRLSGPSETGGRYTPPSAAAKYSAALRPRYAFGSGALHYEIPDQAMGDPDIRATLPTHAAYSEAGRAPSEVGGDDAEWQRMGRETAARRRVQFGGFGAA